MISAQTISLALTQVEPIGVKNDTTLLVEKVSPQGSRCRVLQTAGALKPGFSVRKGGGAVESADQKARLEVISLPASAKVYLDAQFIGESPLTLTDLAPGSYKVEIRSGEGYKPYAAKVHLKNGRTVTLEKELEEELEVEDLLLMGKVPRRATDPGEALNKALIPGMGMAYNGYGNVAPVLPFMMFTFAGAGALNFSEYLNLEKDYQEAKTSVSGGNPSYWQLKKYQGYGGQSVQYSLKAGALVWPKRVYLSEFPLGRGYHSQR